MKKVYIFAGLVLALSVFACTIPTSIEITGTPEVKFAANFNISEQFTDMIGGAFGDGSASGFNQQECVNMNTRTYLIRMDLLNDTFEFVEGSVPTYIEVNGVQIDVTSLGINQIRLEDDVELGASDPTDPIELDFSSLSEYLEGFKFDEDQVKAKLYIDGSEIVDVVHIDFDIGDIHLKVTNEDPGNPLFTEFTRKTSGINPNVSEYTGTSLPPDGIPIPGFASLLNNKEKNNVTYNVYMPAGRTINTNWLGEVDVVVELLIWVPLDLVAGDNGAEFAFPGDFMSGVGGFINSIAEAADSLSLEIQMPQNPFQQGELVIKDVDDGIDIRNSLEDGFIFAISDEDMTKIVDAESFEPEFSIAFAKDKHLIIPRELVITTVSLKAKLHYNVEF